MLIARAPRGRESTVDDKANVRLGSSENLPDIMRVDHFCRMLSRDGCFEQVVEWVESSVTGWTLIRGGLPGDQQHL